VSAKQEAKISIKNLGKWRGTELLDSSERSKASAGKLAFPTQSGKESEVELRKSDAITGGKYKFSGSDFFLG